MSTKSSANAVKHGLSSLRHVPPGRENEVVVIEQELIGTRQPETPEQREIVHDLAFAMWQKGEHDRLWLQQDVAQPIDTEALYTRNAEEAHQKLHELWLANPPTHTAALAQTLAGAKLFLMIWQTFQQSLAEGSPGPSLQMTLDAIRTLGVSTNPNRICGEGERLLVQAVALRAKPSKILMEWLIAEKAVTSSDALDRARAFRDTAQSAGTSRDLLRKRADEKIAHWQKQVEIQVENDELARLEFSEANAHRVVIDPDHEAHLQRMHRYRVFAENRVKDLNRRLANNKAELERKKRHAEAQEERRLNREMQSARLKSFEERNPKPPAPIVESPTKMPDDWWNKKDILPRVRPNDRVFLFWPEAHLQKANDLINYLEKQPNLEPGWLSQIKENLATEVKRSADRKAKSA